MPGGLRPTALRAVIIDDHSISRAACRALLRTEGVNVLADIAADERAAETVAELDPQVVVVDVSPHDQRGIAIAQQIEAMANAPRVVLTSSADLAQFDSRLDGYQFVAKADICSEALTIPARCTQASSPIRGRYEPAG